MKRIAAKNIILLVFSIAFLMVFIFAAAKHFQLQQYPQPGIAEKYALPVTAIILFLITVTFLFTNTKNKQQFSERLNYQNSLIDTVSDAIFSTDKDLRIQSWNRYAAELYGIPVHEAIGQRLDALISIDMSKEEMNDQFQHLLLDNTYRAEYLITKKDGEQVYIMASISTMRNKQGKVTGYVAVHRDISERKMLEDQLKTANKQLERQVDIKTNELSEIFERITDGFIALDSNWNFTYVNKRVYEIFGVTPGDYIGKNMWAAFPDLNNEKYFYELFHRAMETQHFHFREVYYSPLEVWLESYIYPSPTGISVYFRNVTQKKEAEQQAKKSMMFSDIIIDSLPGIFFMYDRDTNALLRWNKRVGSITGFSEAEITGKYFIEFIDPKDHERLMQKIEDSFTTGQGDIEAGIITKKGKSIPFYFTAMVVKIEGKNFLIGNGIDISARKRAEAKSRKNFEQIQLLAMLSEAVSHANNAQQIYQLGLEAVTKNIKASKSGIAVFDDNSEIKFLIDRGLSENFKNKLRRFPVCIPSDKEATFFEVSNFEKEGVNSEIIALFHDENIAAGCYFPIAYQDKIIGKIALYFEAVQTISEEKKQLTETIARGLGFAISEKDAEQALIASKQKYQLLFYNNPMPMWMLSQPEKDFVDVNEAALAQYGFGREEFLKMNLADLRPWNEPEMIMDHPGNPGKSESFSKVWRYKKKNGEIVKVEILENELFYEGKNVLLILANNIDEKVKAEEKLQHSYGQIRQLANHLQNIREEERTHIAREIHDELGQQLTGLKMYVSWLSKKNTSPEAAIKAKFINTMELIEDTIKSVRKISTELRPSMLDDLGLLAAMEWQSNEFGKRYGINAVFINLTGNHPIPARFSTGLFRIFQESLTNVARHADAKKIVSTLLFNNSELVLTIEDDGKGFIVKNIGSKKTLGLFGMKERSMEMGGTYEIKSDPGIGTKVSVKIRIH